MRHAVLLAIALFACSAPPRVAPAPEPLVTLTDAKDREAAVGKTVTIVGVQTRSKIPTVCGVDVDGDEALADRQVTVRGRLEKVVVKEADPYAASRGPGTYYQVVDPATGQLAKPTAR